MKGIENLKKVVIWHTDLIDEIFELVKKKKKKKGKITGWVALKFLDNLFQLFLTFCICQQVNPDTGMRLDFYGVLQSLLSRSSLLPVAWLSAWRPRPSTTGW